LTRAVAEHSRERLLERYCRYGVTLLGLPVRWRLQLAAPPKSWVGRQALACNRVRVLAVLDPEQCQVLGLNSIHASGITDAANTCHHAAARWRSWRREAWDLEVVQRRVPWRLEQARRRKCWRRELQRSRAACSSCRLTVHSAAVRDGLAVLQRACQCPEPAEHVDVLEPDDVERVAKQRDIILVLGTDAAFVGATRHGVGELVQPLDRRDCRCELGAMIARARVAITGRLDHLQ
jgi:hypothetical protein